MKMKTILAVFFTGCVLLTSAANADSAADAGNAKSEIIYRTNLGRADDVRLLIKQGASPDIKDDNGVPLISLAAMRSDGEGFNVVQALIEAGADINAKDSIGQSALFYAAKEGNKDIVGYLLTKGINYYAADNMGNVARNVAHAAKHDDIVALMDAFVKEQTAKVTQQYKDFNKAVEQNNKPPEAQPMPPLIAEPPAPKPESAVTPPEEKKPDPAEEKARQEAAKPFLSKLAFDNCAFQYWYYVHAVKQSNELSKEELPETIDGYKVQVTAMEKQLVDDYHETSTTVAKVSESARKRLFNELNVLPSNIARHEQGVGKKEDMESRCTEIAREWGAESPKELETPPEETAGTGGVGGVNGGNAQNHNSKQSGSGVQAYQPTAPMGSGSTSLRSHRHNNNNNNGNYNNGNNNGNNSNNNNNNGNNNGNINQQQPMFSPTGGTQNYR